MLERKHGRERTKQKTQALAKGFSPAASTRTQTKNKWLILHSPDLLAKIKSNTIFFV